MTLGNQTVDNVSKKILEDASADKENIINDARIKEKEILTKAKECYELNEQKKSFEKKIDEIKTDLQVFMTDKKANRGNAKEYIILLTQKERETIDKNKIPPVILEQAKKLTKFETLSVKKIKGGNGNGK